uniref:Uncharacterized protein n=1 Tax=Arundo donax TaxID=35708 RepID=A0A0A8Y1D6_ARUDO
MLVAESRQLTSDNNVSRGH